MNGANVFLEQTLSRTDRVCEQHFDQTFVIGHFDLTGPDGVKCY